MSIKWIIAGTIAQLMLGAFLFMFAVFGSAGALDHANRAGKQLSWLQAIVIDWSIYTLPAFCLAGAGIVFYCYKNGGGAVSYCWHLLPIIATTAYGLVISEIYA